MFMKRDSALEIVLRQISVIVRMLLQCSQRKAGRGAGGAMLAAARGRAGEDEQSPRPQHARHVQECFAPVRIVLETLARDHDIEGGRRQRKVLAGHHEIDARSHGDIGSQIVAGLKMRADGVVADPASDFENPRCFEKLREVRFDVGYEFLLLKMCHDERRLPSR